MLAPLIHSSEPSLDFHMPPPPQIDQEDLEVEEILNDIGFFMNDAELDTTFLEQDSSLAPITSAESPVPTAAATAGPASYMAAPVSPDHTSSIQPPIQSTVAPLTAAAPSVTPSCSVENLTTFSVPNPMAAIMALESSPHPVSPPLPPIAAAPLPPPITAAKLPARKAPKKKATAAKKTTKAAKRKLAPAAKATISVRGPSSPVKTPKSKAGLPAVRKPVLATIKPGILPGPDDHLTEEQMEERRQRNREHAKRSRQRKKSLTATLQQSVDELKAENAKLRELLNARLGASRTETTLEARRVQSRNNFIEGLRATSRAPLDDTSLNFLRSLRKNAQKKA